MDYLSSWLGDGLPLKEVDELSIVPFLNVGEAITTAQQGKCIFLISMDRAEIDS